jgi:hypothetical protein
MQEHEVRALMDRIAAAMDPEIEYTLRSEDFTVDFPQSGESFDRDGLRELQRHFPGGPPQIQVCQISGGGDVWVVRFVITYAGGAVFHSVNIVEFSGELIRKETRVYGAPFEAPAWRAQWVRREAPVG